jgi:hypothetical protein
MTRNLWTCAVVSVSLAACGGAPAPKEAEPVRQAADRIQKSVARGADSVARGFGELARGLGAMGSRDPNAKPIDPLTIDGLKAALPDLSGWERGKPTGERMTSPVNYAEAKVTFRKGTAQIDQKIVDSALNQMIVAPFTMFLAVGYEKESDHGYEKGVTIGDYPGWEKWDDERRSGELNVIVDQRFIVQIEGRNIDSIKVLHTVMDRTNLRKLSAAK